MPDAFQILPASSSISPRALIVSFSIPYGGTEDLVLSLKNGLSLNGFEPIVVTLKPGVSVTLPSPQSISLAIFVGGPPVDIVVQKTAYWKLLADHAHTHLMLIDPLPYDFKRASVIDFLQTIQSHRNLSASAIDRFDAHTLKTYFGGHIFFMPSPGYSFQHAHKDALIAPQDAAQRLIFWGSIDAELLTSNEAKTLVAAKNIFGRSLSLSEVDALALSGPSIIRYISENHASRLGDWVHSGLWRDIAVIDSYAKRKRRLLILESTRHLPVDFWGKNWGKYLACGDSARCYNPSPDVNRMFPALFSIYRGVLNIEPSFSEGANERSTTAALNGFAMANSETGFLRGIDSIFTYRLTGESIEAAVADALRYSGPKTPRPEFGSETVISQFLTKI